MNLSALFMETITVRELVDYTVADSKLLKFHPEMKDEFERILLGEKKNA